jgi:hypothetical protein
VTLFFGLVTALALAHLRPAEAARG